MTIRDHIEKLKSNHTWNSGYYHFNINASSYPEALEKAIKYSSSTKVEFLYCHGNTYRFKVPTD